MLWPVSNSVARPITKPSIAIRPFHVSANATKPKREVESAMIVEKCFANLRGLLRICKETRGIGRRSAPTVDFFDQFLVPGRYVCYRGGSYVDCLI